MHLVEVKDEVEAEEEELRVEKDGETALASDVTPYPEKTEAEKAEDQNISIHDCVHAVTHESAHQSRASSKRKKVEADKD